MVNTNMLKGKMVEKGLSVASVAKAVGISTASMYRKINNSGDNMLIKEAYAIGKILELSADDINKIFFAPDVS